MRENNDSNDSQCFQMIPGIVPTGINNDSRVRVGAVGAPLRGIIRVAAPGINKTNSNDSRDGNNVPAAIVGRTASRPLNFSPGGTDVPR